MNYSEEYTSKNIQVRCKNQKSKRLLFPIGQVRRLNSLDLSENLGHVGKPLLQREDTDMWILTTYQSKIHRQKPP